MTSTDYTYFVETWTQRLMELAGNGMDEDEVRALVTEIYLEAAGTFQEEMAKLEEEREE